jgi:hypothetical protein
MKAKQTRHQVIAKLITSTGLRARINAHCVSCVYDEKIPGSWKRQVTECTVTSCPIWDIRPKVAIKGPKTTTKVHSGMFGQRPIDNPPITPEWPLNQQGIEN